MTDRRRSLMVVAASAALCVTLTSCLEVELEVRLDADGSGAQRLHLGMNDELIRNVQASARALSAGLDKPKDPLAVYDRTAVTAELEGQGLKVLKHETSRERSRKHVDVEASFGAFATLRASTLFGAEGEWYLLRGRNDGGARLVFYPRGHAAWVAAREQAVQLRNASTPVQQKFFASQKMKVAGLDVALKLKLPGDVDYCSRNMTASDTREVTSRVRADSIRTAADLVLALAPRFEVEFAAKGCSFAFDAEDPGPALLRAQHAAAREAAGRR